MMHFFALHVINSTRRHQANLATQQNLSLKAKRHPEDIKLNLQALDNGN
jgi:hypothetical protein